MYLLFDIGGTKMRLAAARNLEEMGETKIIPTPQKYSEGISLFLQTAQELAGHEKIEAVGGGIAGPFDEAKGTLVGSPQLEDWIGKPFKEEIEKELGAKVMIENDAALAGLGETHFGRGKSRKIVAYITVSTGVGGARIVDGKIDKKIIGFEPGFQIIDAGKTICAGCNSMRLGAMISGDALEKRFGKKAEEIEDPEVWEETAKFLAYGLHNATVFWSPEIILLGGSLMKKIEMGKVKKYLSEILKIFPEIPEVEKAQLGDLGGLWGAMVFLRQSN